MCPDKNNRRIGIFLPPSPRGPGMIKSPSLDVAQMIAILNEDKGGHVQLFDLRSHTVAGSDFWVNKGIDLNIFNDFERCFEHVLGRQSSQITRCVNKILNEVALDGIQFLVFFVSILEQFSLQYFTASLCIAHTLKKRMPATRMVFAGNCPKRHIRNIMQKFKCVDAFLEDGNEFAMLEYIKKFEQGQPLRSVTYREKKQLITAKKKLPLRLNQYPLPNFSLFELEQYKANGNVIFPYELSRGCVNNCFFCYYIYKGGKVYKKDYERAVHQLICLKREYHVCRFHFLDAEINFDKTYLKKFCQELLDQKAEIFWSALAIPADLSPQMLALMRRSGCVQLRFGVESGGPDMLKRINKKTNIDEMSEILKAAHDAGIYTYVTLINGLPKEKMDDVLGTKAFLDRNKAHIDSATLCDYGELGHFGISVLEGVLAKKKESRQQQKKYLTGRLLRDYFEKIGLRQEDIIDDFLSKAGGHG